MQKVSNIKELKFNPITSITTIPYNKAKKGCGIVDGCLNSRPEINASVARRIYGKVLRVISIGTERYEGWRVSTKRGNEHSIENEHVMPIKNLSSSNLESHKFYICRDIVTNRMFIVKGIINTHMWKKVYWGSFDLYTMCIPIDSRNFSNELYRLEPISEWVGEVKFSESEDYFYSYDSSRNCFYKVENL